MNEKDVLAKLVKIASNQQKILERLAQSQDPNVKYLQQAVQVAGVNSGMSITIPRDVQVTLNGTTYDVAVSVPAVYQRSYSQLEKNFYNQIKAQKPELQAKLRMTQPDPEVLTGKAP